MPHFEASDEDYPILLFCSLGKALGWTRAWKFHSEQPNTEYSGRTFLAGLDLPNGPSIGMEMPLRYWSLFRGEFLDALPDRPFEINDSEIMWNLYVQLTTK